MTTKKTGNQPARDADKHEPKAPKTTHGPNTLVVDQKEGQADAIAECALHPSISAAMTIGTLSKSFPSLHLTALVGELSKQAKAAKEGNLGRPEEMLMAQAHTLDAIFNELARRAVLNMGEYINAAETYARLALKAQSQCRATVETLAEMKNPKPVAFVQQANIAQGPQQVNNGVDLSRVWEKEIEQTKLSRGNHELLPDTRAPALASGVNQTVEALGEIDRTEVAGG